LIDAAFNTTASLFLTELNIPKQGWEIEVLPPASADQARFRLRDDEWSDLWLVEIGISPGCTVRFRRID
jgi:hypothetical protein